MKRKIIINRALLQSIKLGEKVYELRDTKLTGFILRVYPSGRMTYVCQYGRGKRLSIGGTNVLTPTIARERAKEILVDVIKGADPQADKRAAKTHTLESYIVDVYEPWVHAHHRNGGATIAMIKANFLPVLGKQKLDEISAWSVEKWRSERLKAGSKPSSLNRYLNALRASLSRAVDWNFIKENPLSRVKPLRTDSKAIVRFLSDEQENRLRAALDSREEGIRQERVNANAWRVERGYELLPDLRDNFTDHLKPLVVLCLNTGLRRGELFNLTWSNVDFEHAMLTVRGDGAKSGQTRHVPLNEDALNTLRLWQTQTNDDSLVFPGKNGKRLTNVKNSWRNLLKAASIMDFRFHDLRHHFASRLVMAGVDLNTVRELLGHSDIKMTLRYAHLAPAVKAAAVQKLERSNNKESFTRSRFEQIKS